MSMHVDQLAVTLEVVRALVTEQFPAWATLPVAAVHSEGTVNAIFRLGDGLAARFPLQPGDVDATRRWLRSEAGAARELRRHTRFPVPEPVAIGEPGAGYPLPWSVQTWVPGTTASHRDASSSAEFARDLATFIEEVRAIDVRGRTFSGLGRGGDLWAHDEWMQVCLEQSRRLLDVSRLRRLWDRWRELPRDSPDVMAPDVMAPDVMAPDVMTHDVMTHGDLTPGNVLVSDGRLGGILDVGGLSPADPALDLVGAWHLLDAGPRRLFREILGCDALEWERGKAWAFEQAMGATWYYVRSNPAMSRMGRRTLERLLDDEPTR